MRDIGVQGVGTCTVLGLFDHLHLTTIPLVGRLGAYIAVVATAHYITQ